MMMFYRCHDSSLAGARIVRATLGWCKRDIGQRWVIFQLRATLQAARARLQLGSGLAAQIVRRRNRLGTTGVCLFSARRSRRKLIICHLPYCKAKHDFCDKLNA